MIKLTTQEMVEKISAMSDVQILARYRKGIFVATASILGTSVLDHNGHVTKLFFYEASSVDDAVLGLFTHLSNQHYIMRKMVIDWATTFELWKYNPTAQKFEKQELK